MAVLIVLLEIPYIRIQTMREWASLQVDYLNEVYKNYISGNYDIYIIFILKGYSFAKKQRIIWSYSSA